MTQPEGKKMTDLTSDQILLIARICYDAIRRLQIENGDPVSPRLEDAEDYRIESMVSGVKFALRGGTPEEQHQEWCRARRTEGWTWGEVKDDLAKTHPCLVPYDQLPASQRVKDALFAGIVQAMAAILG